MYATSKKILIELHYLPSVIFFQVLAQTQHLVLENEEHYIKQTFRNRCLVRASNGTIRLTVPVVRGAKGSPIKSVQIDYSQPWQQQHLRTLQACYGKAPFYAYYAPAFEEILLTGEKYLFDLNLKLLTKCLDFLGFDPTISHTKVFDLVVSDEITDMRGLFRPFDKNGIVPAKKYYQVFGGNFVQGLSVLDILFNEGPNASSILLSNADE